MAQPPIASEDSGNVYDQIGLSYNATRHADPLVGRWILEALGDCGSVLNVGAGTGAYEPQDREVVAVEPSAAMRRARPPGAARCLDASAESLPFDDDSFDAALAVLTVHHWADYRAGLRELRRVARRRVVVFTWDQTVRDQLWLAEYFPDAYDFDRVRAPSIPDIVTGLGLEADVIDVPVPHDCVDGFAGAFWRRPARTWMPTSAQACRCSPKPASARSN